MPTTTTPQLTPNEPSVQYGPVFARYLAGALRQSLAQVQEHRYTVPEDARVQAWHILRLTLDVDELWEQASQLLIALAPRMEMAGFRQDWIPFLEKGIAQAEAVGAELVEAKVRYYLGQIYRMMGMYNEASEQLDEGERAFASLDELNWRGMVLNENAYLAYYIGDYQLTTELAETALSLFDTEHPERALSYYHLGIAAEERQEWDAAHRYYQLGLDIRTRDGDKRRMSMNLRNLGMIYTWKGAYDKAIEVYNDALQSYNHFVAPDQRATVLSSMGVALRRSREPGKALDCYLKALELSRQISDQNRQAAVFNNLGMTYKDLKQWSMAISSAESAVRLYRGLGNMLQAANALDTLGEIYFARGDLKIGLSRFEEALDCIKNMDGISSTVYYQSITSNIQKAKDLLEICTRPEGHVHSNSKSS